MGVVFPFYWLLGCAAVCLVGWRRLGTVASPWTIFGIALAVRLVPALVASTPSGALIHYDLESMDIVARLVRRGEDVYAATARYPYLPFQMYLWAAASWLSEHAGLPFEVLIKLPLALSDALICVLMSSWNRQPAAGEHDRAALIYAFNPVSITVACIHGQFDSTVIAFLVASMLLVRRRARPAFAGAVFGLSILAKPWPIFLLPLALSQLGRWRQRAEFVTGAGVVILLVTLLYCAVFAVSPLTVAGRVGGYSSMVGAWGIPLIASRIAGAGMGAIFAAHGVSAEIVLQVGKLLLLLLLASAGIWLQRLPIERACCIVLLAFDVFTYGWGFHYLAWVVPFLLLADQGVAAWIYLASATLSLLVVLYGMGGLALMLPGWPLAVTHPAAAALFMWSACIVVSLLLLVEWLLGVPSLRRGAELEVPPRH